MKKTDEEGILKKAAKAIGAVAGKVAVTVSTVARTQKVETPQREGKLPKKMKARLPRKEKKAKQRDEKRALKVA